VRHNRVRHLLEGLLSPVVEVRDILSDSEARPGDVTLPNWSGGRPLAIDVAVTSPFSVFGMRSENPADSYSDVYKHGKYDKKFRGNSCMFAGLVMETTGGLSQEATSLLKAVFRFGSKRQNIQHCVYAGRAWARLSCNLQTSVAQQILCRIDGWALQPRRTRLSPTSPGSSSSGPTMACAALAPPAAPAVCSPALCSSSALPEPTVHRGASSSPVSPVGLTNPVVSERD